MTVPVDEIMRVVRTAVQPFVEHREYEDIYSEALIHAWQQVDRREWRSWTTVAWNAARWQAGEYLRQRRSGKLTSQREAPVYPYWLADLPPDRQPVTDGGLDAADVRLQLWLFRDRALPAPPREDRECRECGRSIDHLHRRARYCSPRCKQRHNDQQRPSGSVRARLRQKARR